MICQIHALVIAFFGWGGLACPAQEAAHDVKELVGMLGDNVSEKRDEATRLLVGREREAKDLVRDAARSKDPEVSLRAGMILKSWAWRMPVHVAQKNPSLGQSLEADTVEARRAALSELAQDDSDETARVLVWIARKQEASADLRMAAAHYFACKGVKESPRPTGPPGGLSVEESAALRSRPTAELVGKAVELLLAGRHGGKARAETFRALNELAGDRFCTVDESLDTLPEPVAGPVVREFTSRWGSWWAKEGSRFPGSWDPGDLLKDCGPYTDVGVYVEAMLGDPGTPRLGREGEIIAKSTGESELTGDDKGRIKEIRDPANVREWQYTYATTPWRMVRRTNPQGEDQNIMYAEDGRVQEMVCRTGPMLWKLVLEGGRARKLYRDDKLVLEFPQKR